MKTLNKPRKPKRLTGTCQHCGTRVETNEKDRALKTLTDHDSPSGAFHVKCPNRACGNKFLWVS